MSPTFADGSGTSHGGRTVSESRRGTNVDGAVAGIGMPEFVVIPPAPAAVAAGPDAVLGKEDATFRKRLSYSTKSSLTSPPPPDGEDNSTRMSDRSLAAVRAIFQAVQSDVDFWRRQSRSEWG